MLPARVPAGGALAAGCGCAARLTLWLGQLVESDHRQMFGFSPGLEVPAVVASAYPVDAGVRDQEIAGPAQRVAANEAVDDIEHPAMGDDHHCFAAVIGGDPLQP